MPNPPNIHKNAFTEYSVDVGKTHYFLFQGGEDFAEYNPVTREDIHKFCAVPVRFNFEENKSYDLKFYLPSTESCYVELYELSDSEARKLKTFSNAASEENAGCMRWVGKRPLY